MMKKKTSPIVLASATLEKHFRKLDLNDLVTSSRSFPMTARVDVQFALEKLFSQPTVKLYGIHRQHSYETLTFANLLQVGNDPVVISPLQYEEVDIGDTLPARCLRQGLWLSLSGKTPFAMLLSPDRNYGKSSGEHLEIMVPPGEAGSDISRKMFNELEALVKKTASYRGKVVSLEQPDRYTGHIGMLRVHKLKDVRREDVILPTKTLQLLDRNVKDFIAQRENLRKLGMPAKKGILLYGPPGTGKTHTIQYLASQLPDHTTLLITAEQMGLLDHYFQLARFLQPAMIVIEDVDLIGRTREEMNSPCEESLLNKLLNEMDGLREDAAILFVLTTNRPEHLEAALASRPGRIDQAIEFPLPDDQGRRQLIRLYAGGLSLSDDITGSLVKKSKGASAAFIKELMRRAAQFYLHNGGKNELTANDVDSALEEMLFAGGSLNAKLLGATGVLQEAA